MQKKVIALAVAGLVSGAAFAQSNVTVYGVVDTAFVQSSGDRAGTAKGNANYNGIDSGVMAGSRIGFKGEEGLGNGLKTIFTLEYYIAPDINSGIGSAPTTQGAGGSSSNSRQTFVGLSHNKLGTLTMGRQYGAGYYSQVRNDAFGGSANGALAAANGAAINTIIAGGAARLNNSFVYTSPNWSGFTVVGGYSYAEGGGTTGNGVSEGANGVFTSGLNYANGPLNLDLVYHSRMNVKSTAVGSPANATSGGIFAGSTVTGLNTLGASAATGDNINEWMLGGSYDFKVVKLYATYQDQNDNNGNSNVEASNKVWSIGATMPVFGNGTIRASYADVSWDRTGAGDSSVWALGYSHALSKRTSLYTSYTHANNDKDVLNAAGMVGNTKFRGESNSTIAAGINHSF